MTNIEHKNVKNGNPDLIIHKEIKQNKTIQRRLLNRRKPTLWTLTVFSQY